MNLSEGRPELERAAMTAEGPGIGTTFIFASIAVLIRLYPGSDIIDSPISSYIFSMINLPGLLVISSFLDYFNAYAITGIHVFIATIIGIISYFLTGVLVYIIISLIKKVINQVSNNA